MGTTFDALTSGDAVINTQVSEAPTVEPLSGPVPIRHLMRRFPEAVYQQGPDTHLYHFVSALCGDAGAGLLKKQSYLARLASEGEVLQFRSLDDFYVQHFGFKRLRSEVYDLDPETMTMTPAEWDDIHTKDDAYRHRIQQFFAATRLGPTVEGMELAAEAGSGVECEVRPNFKYIYDRYSDDPLGLEPVGRTESVNEFVILPRVVKDGVLLPVSYEAAYDYDARPVVPDFDMPTPSSQEPGRPARITNERTVDGTITETPTFHLEPAIHHNMLDTLDRLRPVTSAATVMGQRFRRSEVPINGLAASSVRRRLSRFVNGAAEVSWPTPDRETGMFIQPAQESEARYYADQHVEILVIFHTVEGVSAYIHEALADPDYGVPAFYSSDGIASAVALQSIHYGAFNKRLTEVYPILAFEADRSHDIQYAVPAQNTMLVLDEGWVA